MNKKLIEQIQFDKNTVWGTEGYVTELRLSYQKQHILTVYFHDKCGSFVIARVYDGEFIKYLNISKFEIKQIILDYLGVDWAVWPSYYFYENEFTAMSGTTMVNILNYD